MRNIPEIKELVKVIHSVSVFVKSHRLVKAAYKHISQQVDPKGINAFSLPSYLIQLC